MAGFSIKKSSDNSVIASYPGSGSCLTTDSAYATVDITGYPDYWYGSAELIDFYGDTTVYDQSVTLATMATAGGTTGAFYFSAGTRYVQVGVNFYSHYYDYGMGQDYFGVYQYLNIANATITVTAPGPTVTSLNGGTGTTNPCNIGSAYNIVGTGFTGTTAVSINGVSASFSVTNSTTISVTIPAMSTYGTSKSVSVTNGTTASANVAYINTPTISISAPATGGNVLASSTTTCTASVTNLASTTINWTCSGGSFSPTSTTSGGNTTWTAPASPSSNGAAYTITATAAGNSSTTTSITRNVFYSPTVTSFTSSPASGSTITNGSTVALSWATSNATSTSTNFGSSATSGSGVTVTPASNTTTTYTVAAVNAAATSSNSSVSITAIAAAAISSYGANAYNILYNNYTQVQCTFSGGGTTVCNIGTTAGGSQIMAGAVSGTYYDSPHITANTTIYFTVSNAASSTSASFLLTSYPLSFTSNDPVLLNTNVTLTGTFSVVTSIATPTVSPGSWTTWVTATGQTVALPYNKLYTMTQTGTGQTLGTQAVSIVPRAKLPTTPAASISMSQMRQITTGGGTAANYDMDNATVRTLAGVGGSGTSISFSQLSGKYLGTGTYFT